MTTTTTGFIFTEQWSILCDCNVSHCDFKDRIEQLKVGNDIKFLSLSTRYVNHMMVDYVIAIREKSEY